MVASRTRTTILYLAIGIPLVHFFFESLAVRQNQFYYPPNLPPPPPGWDPSQGWDWLKEYPQNAAGAQAQAVKSEVKATTEKVATSKLEPPASPIKTSPILQGSIADIKEDTEDEAYSSNDSPSEVEADEINESEEPEYEESSEPEEPLETLETQNGLNSDPELDNDRNIPSPSKTQDYDQSLWEAYKKDAASFEKSNDYSDPIKDEAREARKAQRLALRMALKNDEPPPDDYFESVPEFTAKFTPYSVLADELNIRNIPPEGLAREEAPVMMMHENVADCTPTCPPGVFLPMPREWYDDPAEIKPLTTYNYFLNPYNFCGDQKEFKLLILVRSLPWNFDRRKVIRSTWMQDIAKFQGDVKVLFYTGVDYHGGRQQQLIAEANQFNDVLQSDVTISPLNVTYHYPAMYNWVDLYCSNVVYVMNLDDNVVPFIDAIMKGPLNPPPESYGYRDFQCSKIIQRPKMDPEHTYVLTGEENKAAKYTRERLPAMCFSYCMLLSRDVVRVLLFGSMSTKYLNIPDMDITGITREKFSLDPPVDLLAGPYLCQHVDKKMSHTTEIAYDYQTVEERIAAAWEHTRDSPVSKNIMKRIDAVLERRDRQRAEF